ncbi:hypothetical protein E8E13_001485 [Curvularia kusanoi]|uniref:Uncharacterized protein n=1 Tax=Curvularia kusanoi TaxID=90978 RepID=A0A9P4T3Z4_CURKU|nr:hypothetical protein E8E13_001485 [Curvularia kusanoi]
MRISNHITLLPLTVLIHPAVAQNSTSANSTCKATLETEYPVNASALVEVPSSGTPPWYLGVTFSDKRNDSNPDQSIYGSLSTPTNSTAYACTRLLQKLLPATGTGANGNCSGILSENCIDFLRRSLVLTQADVERRSCPDVPVASDVARACPPLAGSSANFGSGPALVSNSTCAASRLAGLDQPPEGYDNSGLFGIFGFGDDESDADVVDGFGV